MKPTGIRQVLAEQGMEGAIIYLHEKLEEMTAQLEQMKASQAAAATDAPKEEV